MGNIIRSCTQTVLLFVSQYLSPGDTVIDATCGNGHDTVALAKMGAGTIYAFDIQNTAIEQTRAALEHAQLYSENIHLIADGHENMRQHVKEKVSVILFNLGYLPSSSKEITTKKETTVKAVSEALKPLKKDGLLCITLYSGHPGGEEEKQAVLRFARMLDPKVWHVAFIRMLNQPNQPPEILLITLKRGVQFEEDKNCMYTGADQPQ